jgi:two-component system sensor histidine kinase RegB
MNAVPDADPTPARARLAHQVASGGVHARWGEAALRAAVSASAPPALLANLRQLMILRGIAIGGQTAAIATAWYLGVSLPLAAMARIVGALIVLNIVTWLRLRRPRATSHVEIAAHLGIDLAAICGLLYFSGGIANPFSLLLVLHVVLMALLLPSLAAAAATTLVAACFVMLGRVHLPFVMTTGDPLPPSLVALGQWLSFALTAAVVASFLTRIVATLRDYDRLLSRRHSVR